MAGAIDQMKVQAIEGNVEQGTYALHVDPRKRYVEKTYILVNKCNAEQPFTFISVRGVQTYHGSVVQRTCTPEEVGLAKGAIKEYKSKPLINTTGNNWHYQFCTAYTWCVENLGQENERFFASHHPDAPLPAYFYDMRGNTQTHERPMWLDEIMQFKSVLGVNRLEDDFLAQYSSPDPELLEREQGQAEE